MQQSSRGCRSSPANPETSNLKTVQALPCLAQDAKKQAPSRKPRRGQGAAASRCMQPESTGYSWATLPAPGCRTCPKEKSSQLEVGPRTRFEIRLYGGRDSHPAQPGERLIRPCSTAEWVKVLDHGAWGGNAVPCPGAAAQEGQSGSRKRHCAVPVRHRRDCGCGLGRAPRCRDSVKYMSNILRPERAPVSMSSSRASSLHAICCISEQTLSML